MKKSYKGQGAKKDKILEAIDFLKANESSDGYVVKFSGGKDSIVVYDIVKKSGVKHSVYYNFTTIDPPEVTRFILKHYPEVKWLRPKQTFFQFLLKAGLPTKAKRWCCGRLKHRIHPKDASRHIVVGVRAEESAKRAKRERISHLKDGKRVTMYFPIFYFNEGEVWEYIEENNLPYPSLYDEGFSRLGCVVCPFICRSGILERHKKRWPRIYYKFEKTVDQLYENKKEWYQSHDVYSAKELLTLWYGNKSILKRKHAE